MNKKAPSNNDQLRELIAKHGKSRKDVATILGVEPSTVDRWLAPRKKPNDKRRNNATYRAMPESALILVKLWLGEMKITDLKDKSTYA